MLFIQAILFYFNLISTKICQYNRHFLILDKHGSHVTIKAIKQTYEAGLDMITLPSHTSHALHPLDVKCFKPFKFDFKKERDESMLKNNHRELDNVTLVSWADRIFNQSLSKQNIKVGFKTTGIWPLNPRAMDN